MAKFTQSMLRSAVTSFLAFGVMSAATLAGDLRRTVSDRSRLRSVPNRGINGRRLRRRNLGGVRTRGKAHGSGQGCAGKLRRSGRDPRTMAGFTVPLRPDPFSVRAYLQAGWGHEAPGGVGPSRHSGGEAARRSGSAAKGCCPSGE